MRVPIDLEDVEWEAVGRVSEEAFPAEVVKRDPHSQTLYLMQGRLDAFGIAHGSPTSVTSRHRAWAGRSF